MTHHGRIFDVTCWWYKFLPRVK